MINQFTKNSKPTLSADRKPGNPRRSRAIGMLLIFGFFALVMSSLVWLRLHYQARTEELNNESARIDRQIEKDRLVIKNLRNHKEKLCSWNHVSRKLAEYKLPLQPRKTSQVSYLKRFKAPDQSHSIRTASAEETAAPKETQSVAAADSYVYHSEY